MVRTVTYRLHKKPLRKPSRAGKPPLKLWTEAANKGYLFIKDSEGQ